MLVQMCIVYVDTEKQTILVLSCSSHIPENKAINVRQYALMIFSVFMCFLHWLFCSAQ